MKTLLLTTAAALIAVANPANAQILGGGGGILGGAPIPVIPNIPAMPLPVPVIAPVSTVTSGSVTSTVTGATSKSVDAHTGKVNASGSASASGTASADAQLLGAGALSGTLQQTHDAAGNLVTTFQDRAGNFVTATRDRAGNLLVTTRDRAGNLLSTTNSASGSAQGSASGSANGTFSGLSHNLALDGSAAGDAAGSFDVKPGTSLFDMNGEKVGKVREVFADASGRVKGLLIKSGDTTALLPVGDFAASGNALVTSLSQTQIAATGEGQANGSAEGSANGIFSGLSHNLALSGSAAADAAGSLDLKPGTQLFDMTGEKIGKVKEVIADAKGHVTALVVKVKDATATLPSADFAANGDVLVTAMSQAQIKATGDKQASAGSSSEQKASSTSSPMTQSVDAAPQEQGPSSSASTQPGAGTRAGASQRHSANTKGHVNSN